MHPHPLLAFGALLAEGKSLDRMIDGFLLAFSAAGLPALLGLLALWLGRLRASWAPLALVLGVVTLVLTGFSLRILYAMMDGMPWYSAYWPYYATTGGPFLLGLGVCVWACRCWWWPPKEETSPHI